MAKVLLSPNIAMLWAVLGCVAVASGAGASPVCKVESPSVNLGNVRVGTTVQHGFEVRNAGDEKLVLKQKSKSCGCQVVLGCDAVEPGATGKITIGFEMKSARVVDANVFFESNDPAHPSLSLAIKCRGVSEVFTEPSYVNLDKMEVGKGQTVVLDAQTPEGGANFRIVQIRSSAAWIEPGETVSFPTDAANHHTFELKLEPQQQGRVREHVTLRTDNPKAPLLEVPVSGEVKGPYTVEPNRLLFGVRSANERGSQSVVIRRTDKQRFSIRPGKSDGTQVQLLPQEATVGADGTSFAACWTAKVALSAPTKPGLWKKEVPFVMIAEGGAEQTLLVQAAGTVKKAASP